MLDKAGLKKTNARIAFCILLLNNPTKPLSIEFMTNTLSLRGIDRVTVYRIADALSKKGILKRVDVGSREAQYEIVDQKEDHHHIICLECKTVSDFTGCESEAIIDKALRQVKNFKSISHHSFDLWGLCNTCAHK